MGHVSNKLDQQRHSMPLSTPARNLSNLSQICGSRALAAIGLKPAFPACCIGAGARLPQILIPLNSLS